MRTKAKAKKTHKKATLEDSNDVAMFEDQRSIVFFTMPTQSLRVEEVHQYLKFWKQKNFKPISNKSQGLLQLQL